MTKREEYTLMQTSKPDIIITPIKGGKSIKWLKAWDHHAGLNQITLRTTMKPPYEHKLITVEEIDLMPVANLIIYKITIKRN